MTRARAKVYAAVDGQRVEVKLTPGDVESLASGSPIHLEVPDVQSADFGPPYKVVKVSVVQTVETLEPDVAGRGDASEPTRP